MFISNFEAGLGWATNSARVLQKWGLVDFIPRTGSCRSAYRQAVTKSLEATCASRLKDRFLAHSAQVPYHVFALHPGGFLSILCHSTTPWDVLIGVGSFYRLRAGLISLRHLHGRQSAARYQNCVACNASIRNATVHTLGRCRTWTSQRDAFLNVTPSAKDISPDKLTAMILQAGPASPGFCIVVRWAVEIDRLSTS